MSRRSSSGSTRARRRSRRSSTTPTSAPRARPAARSRSPIPARAGSSRTRRTCSWRWSRPWASCSPAPTARSSPAGSTTRASRSSPGTPRAGEPLTPIVTWQDKRSQEVLDRLEADGGDAEVRERSGMPLDPYFSAGKLTWLLEHDDAVVQRPSTPGRCGSGRSTRSSATARARASRPTPPRRRAPSSAPARPTGTRSCSTAFGVPHDSLPAIARHRRRPRRRSVIRTGPVSCRCGRRSWTSRPRSPERAASSPAWSKATYGTGVFVLAHAGTDRPEPVRGRAPADGRLAGGRARWSTPSTAACSPPARCSSG